ncbi:MAG TPA: NUDIX domain-containing protein [Puia sp.]|nr:NUDIX domain-containing protein [Puia sp.]
MNKQQDLLSFLSTADKQFMPALSVDCVIFGFHENEMKVLLLKMKKADEWSLPGGFIYKNEDIERAAVRVLKERTGLDDIFLKQFHVFGDPARSNLAQARKRLEKHSKNFARDNFLLQRFVTVGFYALVDFFSANPMPDSLSEACIWWDLHHLPDLIMDHRHIFEKALETLRHQINHQPIGYNLLPEKFTMPELQKLYETILDKKLDRRNFQRRMLGYGILRRLKERRRGGAHKAPFLYSFNLRRYHLALEEGLQGGW